MVGRHSPCVASFLRQLPPVMQVLLFPLRLQFVTMVSQRAAAQFLLLLAVVHAAEKLPSYVTKCTSREPAKLNPCALENARAVLVKLGAQGDRKYGIAPIDVNHFPLIETDSNGFKLKFIDAKITTDPPKSFNVDDVNIDLDRRHLQFNYSAPALVMTAKYETDGRILILPIKGDGQATIRIDGYKAQFSADFDLVKNEKDGMDYVKLKNTFYDSQVSKVTHNFTNLFNGEETLGKATNDFLNENWKEVFEETKWSTFEANKQFIASQMQNFFDRVPYKEAFPE